MAMNMVTFNNGYNSYIGRKTLIEAHISDIHFGSFDPKTQYDILVEQFISPLELMPVLDIISIDGDLFHHKTMSNSDIAMYATMFIDEVIMRVVKPHNSTLVLELGTDLHDAKQLKLFYHYINDPTLDIRIVENIQFEYIKGAKILCIPDLPGIDESVYRHFLFESGTYDSVFMHGTIKGAVPKDEVGNCRLFTIEDFALCKGPIISGHVHTGGCFNSYFNFTVPLFL
jgi:hypothetical protein